MKTLVTLFAALAISAGAAFAGCGMKDTDTGKLTSYDKEKKVITVEAQDGTKAMLTMTPDTATKNAKGEAAKIDDLIGKQVEVVSEHKKIDSVTAKEA